MQNHGRFIATPMSSQNQRATLWSTLAPALHIFRQVPAVMQWDRQRFETEALGQKRMEMPQIAYLLKALAQENSLVVTLKKNAITNGNNLLMPIKTKDQLKRFFCARRTC
jgi:hypothetical protein